MNTTRTCPECGKPVAPNGLRGLCPECMMKVGLAAQTGEAGPGGTQVVPPQAKPPPALAEVAVLFPQLEILECLGSGGMGAVYKARQPRLDRLVALKILCCDREDATREARFAERFEREARALAKLSHPHIVAMYEFGQVAGLPYFIMEHVEGLNLRQLERAGKLSPREALEIIPQICEALQFAHDEGIVHRDIKPENILLDKKGRVKIADFGIAKIVGKEGNRANLTAEQQVIGTPHYMAPEQVEHPQQVDHRADIYSLGVVFYEMLTGELPLGKFAPPSKKVSVDVRLDEVVLHTLEKEPERRYQHASEVRTDVESIASGVAPACHSPQPATPEGGAKLVAWTDVMANLWALAAIVLLVGRKVARTEPLMYSFFGTGGWHYPANYSLLVAVCFGLAGVCLVIPHLTKHGRARRGSSTIWGDLLGSAWALAALVLLVGRKVARTEPLMYSFFDVGGWFYPSSYHLLVAVCFGFALACLVIPRLSRRTGGRETTGHGQTVSTAAPDEQALAAVRSQLKAPAIGVFAAGCLNLAMIAGVLLKFILATAAESPDRTMTHFASLPLLAMLFVTGVIIAGARLMGRVANHGLAVTASVLAILLPPGAVVGLPFGIWSLIVLYRPDVRAAFEGVARKGASAPAATPAHTSSTSVPRLGVTWATVAGVTAAVMVLLVFLLVIVVPSLQRAPSAASAFGPEIEVSLSSLGSQAGDHFLDLDVGRIVRPPGAYSGWSRERKHEWLREQGIDLMLMGSAFQSWSLLTPVDNETKLTKVSARAWQQGLDSEDGGRPPESAEAIQFVTQGVELLQVRLEGRPTHPDHTFAFQTANGARGVVKVSGLNLDAGDEIVGLKLRFKLLQPATTVRASPREVVAEWLRLVKAGSRDAWDLTTRSNNVGWGPSFTGLWEFDRIRPRHQLGSKEQAIVLSNPFNDNSGRERVFYAVLRQRDGQWLVDRHSSGSPSEVVSLLEGFAVNPGMKFDVLAAELVGEWGAVCESTISLAADGTGAQLRVGPGGPEPGAKPEPFQWEVSGSILRRHFTDRQENLEILWMGDHDVQFRSPNDSDWDAWWRTPQGD